MKNAFNGFSRLHTAEESELQNISLETYKTEKKKTRKEIREL